MNEAEPYHTFPPNDSLKPITPLIGTWVTTGTHGMIPNTPLHGQTSFSWHESKAFILMRSSITEAVGIPDGCAILSSDDTLATYIMAYYDERGVSRHYHVRMDKNVMKWWRDAPDFHQRYLITISDDEQHMDGKGEISKDGLHWEHDLNLQYTKVRS